MRDRMKGNGEIPYVATLALFQACAVQGQVGIQSTTLAGGSNEFVTIVGAEETLTTTGFAFYDSTGILLASLSNAGRVQQARQAAALQASPGETFTFSVDMAAPPHWGCGPSLNTFLERVKRSRTCKRTCG